MLPILSVIQPFPTLAQCLKTTGPCLFKKKVRCKQGLTGWINACEGRCTNKHHLIIDGKKSIALEADPLRLCT